MAIHFDEIPVTRIEVGKTGYFTVRGLNTEDLTFLTRNYLEDMQQTVARYGGQSVFPQGKLGEIVMDLAKDFPAMVTEIISRCAEAETAEQVELFRRLSFVKQIEALRAIALLTMEDSGIELGKFGGVLASLLEAVSQQPGPLRTLLQTIIVQSENPSAS